MASLPIEVPALSLTLTLVPLAALNLEQASFSFFVRFPFLCFIQFFDILTVTAQFSINGVGLTKPLTTSLNPTSKHSSHLREPNRVVGRGEVGITGYLPNIDAW